MYDYVPEPACSAKDAQKTAQYVFPLCWSLAWIYMFSGFISTAANVIYITSMINHLLTSFSAVQIYDADLSRQLE